MTDELTTKARAHARARARAAATLEELTAAALAELRAGVPPTEVARRAGWSTTYLRRIARAAGIAPR